jgi:cytochrome c oxidase subunit 1
MGAVFGIFAGFFYWFNVITGSEIDKIYGQIVFWILFIGVNLTFFPMHFLGLAGMPRRIPDYPDVYEGWNKLASFGSLVTTIGIIAFFIIVYVSFTVVKTKPMSEIK